MFIINAPWYFSGIWGIVKVFLDQKVKDKIKIYGGEYYEALKEDIDEENIPEWLGGKCRHRLSENRGPWNPEGKNYIKLW